MEFKGRVEEIIDKSGTSKKGEPFVAYQILVEEEMQQYPQSGVFDTFGDKITLPAVGDLVTVNFNMKATKWEGKIFGKNNAWKIEVEKSVQNSVNPVTNTIPSAPTPEPNNDLPF